jgi:hypothetical protein
MQTYTGTHGTSLKRARNIQAEGFYPTGIGRAGRGVYFWQYRKNPKIAVQLAKGWYDFRFRNAEYKDEKDPQCAVICASVDVDEDDVLDCTTDEVLEDIALSLNNLDVLKDSDVHAAYEKVLNDVEKALGRPMIVVKARVPHPPKMSFTLKSVIGNPAVFVVRDKVKEIKISAIQ